MYILYIQYISSDFKVDKSHLVKDAVYGLHFYVLILIFTLFPIVFTYYFH